jgi:PncC family amidohydrolase
MIESLVKEIAQELLDRKMTIGTAESCTSGLIAASLASINGASKYFRGGIVSYATDLKTKLLHVSNDCILSNDVVSSQVAASMAFGGLGSLDVDMCIAITGYAGDTGGSEKSPRGTIHICTAKRLRNVTSFNYKMINVNESRGKNIEKCLEAALETALEHLRKND